VNKGRKLIILALLALNSLVFIGSASAKVNEYEGQHRLAAEASEVEAAGSGGGAGKVIFND
jgi:hypothetical protein